MSWNEIRQEINTNIADNDHQLITAEKVRSTLIDIVNESESVEDKIYDEINIEKQNILDDVNQTFENYYTASQIDDSFDNVSDDFASVNDDIQHLEEYVEREIDLDRQRLDALETAPRMYAYLVPTINNYYIIGDFSKKVIYKSNFFYVDKEYYLADISIEFPNDMNGTSDANGFLVQTYTFKDALQQLLYEAGLDYADLDDDRFIDWVEVIPGSVNLNAKIFTNNFVYSMCNMDLYTFDVRCFGTPNKNFLLREIKLNYKVLIPTSI